MITLNQVGMTYGQKLLFYDVSCSLNMGQSYALVGANGCGKSTLFNLITGAEELSEGSIMIPHDASIGWLKQDQFRYEDTLIQDIVLQGQPILWNAMQEKEALLSVDTWTDQQGFRFAELEELIFQNDGYLALTRVESILCGLGIATTYHQKPLSALSGGYKLRVLLAQTLFQNPSILLLDEPTNHLDLLSIQWLEKFLKEEFQGLVLFISHDREFIDHLADFILDIDFGEIRKYSGHYATFLAEKAQIQEQKLVEKRSAEEKVAHMQSFINRFGAKASKAAQARSRMKMIEKIEIPDVLHTSRVAPHLQFTPSRPSGKNVCKIEGLSKSFHGQVLFKPFSAQINRHDKIAILGSNGRGKSTLVKMILDYIERDTGEITWGTEVKISYFSQDHHELLNYSISVLHWLENVATNVSSQRIRQVLGQVLFTKEEVDKDILNLSGGEAARLLLAKVILEAPNVLILDEPTNHMDLETIEALASALKEYTGTLIVVSHNRYFVEQIATRTWYFSETQGIKDIKGVYHP